MLGWREGKYMLDNLKKVVRINNRNPVFVLNASGDFTDVKDDFCREIGFTKDEILGKKIWEVDFLTEVTHKKLSKRRVSGCTDKNRVIKNFEVVTRNGDVLSLDLDAAPVSKDGEVVGEMFTVRKTSITVPDDLKRRKPVINKISEMQHDLSRKQQEIEAITVELEARNAIIDEIKKQLTEKQINLVEKSGVFDQLQTGIEQQNREIRLKSEELGVAKLEIEEKAREVDHIRAELENKNRELLLKNVEINELQTKLEEMNEEVNASRSALKWFKIELERKQDELQSMNTELETRNAIISEVKKQLTERQTEFIGKTKSVSDLQVELESKQEEIDALSTRLQGFTLADSGRIVGGLKGFRTEIDRIDNVLREKQKELESLNKCIEAKTGELEDLNSKLEEHVSALKLAESQIGRRKMEQVVEETRAEAPTGEVLRDKIKLFDEIDRCLDATSSDIKTKKIEEEKV